MKASVNLRRSEDEADHNRSRDTSLPLLRAKVPITILGLPFISSASASPDDVSLHLRTDFVGGPSLRLSYHPTTIQHQPPFSLTLKSGLGFWGSPRQSPILFSAHLPLPGASPPLPTTPPISFSVQINANFGDFSFKKSVPTSSFQTPAAAALHPNPYPKENGGSIYRPLPVVREDDVAEEQQQHRVRRDEARDWLLSGSGVMVRTAFPVSRRAELKLRWGVNFPASAAVAAMAEGIGGNRSLPFMVVDKISIESIVKEEEEEEEERTAAATWEG